MTVGLPLDLIYGQVYSQLAAIPTANLQAILQSQGIRVRYAIRAASLTNHPAGSWAPTFDLLCAVVMPPPPAGEDCGC